MTEVRDSRKENGGRGVFATKPYKAGDTIEVAHVITCSLEDAVHLNRTKLTNYIFQWGDKHVAVALGNVSLYNHDYNSNCIYEMCYESETMEIKAVCKIAHGAELCINYNGSPNNRKPIWFSCE